MFNLAFADYPYTEFNNGRNQESIGNDRFIGQWFTHKHLVLQKIGIIPQLPGASAARLSCSSNRGLEKEEEKDNNA